VNPIETRKTSVTFEPAKTGVEPHAEHPTTPDLDNACEGGKHRRMTRIWRLGYQWRWPLFFALLSLLFCEAAWLTFLTPKEADVLHYECYGLTFWLGSHGATLLPPQACSFLPLTPPQAALHMLPAEYPSLTILLFSLPLLAPLPYYSLVFALLMTLSAGLICWLLARSGTRRAAPIFLLYLLLGTAGVFQERFDLLPAACTLLCLLAAERGRWRAAYFALALGVLLKLYPIVMLPALFLAEQHAWLSASNPHSEAHSAHQKRSKHAEPGTKRTQRQKGTERNSWLWWAWENITRWTWRNCLLCVGLLCVVMGGFALLNFQAAVLSPLTYFLNRPPQIESLSGSIIWLGDHFGAPGHIEFSFGSLNIISSLAPLISPVNSLLTVAVLLALFWLQWRKRIDLAQTLTGLVCVLIVTGKVFSPQYLIWLIPFLAVLAARGQTNRLWMLSWTVISLLTTFIYIFYYSRLPDPETAAKLIRTLPGFFELVALRNALLLVTTLAFICGWWKTQDGA
jgi:hypothetical protein